MGVCLGEVLDEARKYRNYARRMKHENLAVNAAAYERLASILTDRTKCFIPTSVSVWMSSIISRLRRQGIAGSLLFLGNTALLHVWLYHDALPPLKGLKAAKIP